MSKRNRIFNMGGVKTTCLAKYRSIKTHQGLLERVSRERMNNGMYKIQAQTTWHDRTFGEMMKLYIKEITTGEKVLTHKTLMKELHQ